MSNEWIEVDRAGLAKQLSRKGKAWVLYELIQNGLDEDGVTQVDVTLDPAPEHRGYVLSYKFADEIAGLGTKLATHLAKDPNSKINLFLAEG